MYRKRRRAGYQYLEVRANFRVLAKKKKLFSSLLNLVGLDLRVNMSRTKTSCDLAITLRPVPKKIQSGFSSVVPIRDRRCQFFCNLLYSVPEKVFKSGKLTYYKKI